MMVIRPEIQLALHQGRAVVALESTLIAHGLPWPINLETARAAEAAIRAAGAIPATIAVLSGEPVVGLDSTEIENLARANDVMKASRRDLAIAIAQKRNAATTVAATMALAHQAGIRVFATGGIGGAHHEAWDISADLGELARTPVAVVCSGAKSILDIPRTLELLESLSVPVLGFKTDSFPAFYLVDSGAPVMARMDSAADVASVLREHWQLRSAGVVVAQPLPGEFAIGKAEWDLAFSQVLRLATEQHVRGKDVTPFLLARLHEITGGKTLSANQALIVSNARLAAEIAMELVVRSSDGDCSVAPMPG
jgi:pseudouridine-5'-phosphate glycosidase